MAAFLTALLDGSMGRVWNSTWGSPPGNRRLLQLFNEDGARVILGSTSSAGLISSAGELILCLELIWDVDIVTIGFSVKGHHFETTLRLTRKERQTPIRLILRSLEDNPIRKSLEVLVATNPETIDHLVKLAAQFRRDGRYAESEKLQIYVIEVERETLGKEHPAVTKAVDDLAEMRSEVRQRKRGPPPVIVDADINRGWRGSETAATTGTDTHTNFHTPGDDSHSTAEHGEDTELEPLLSIGPRSDVHHESQRLVHDRRRAEQLRRLELLEEAICSLTQERRTLQGAVLAAYSTEDTSHVFLITRPDGTTHSSSRGNFISAITSKQCLTTLTSLLGGVATLSLGGAFMLGMQETDTTYHQPSWLPLWLTSQFLFCLSASLFLILGVYMTLVEILKHASRQSDARLLKWCVVWLSSFGSFALAVSSVFVYREREAVSSLLGGLGNASQVFVIFLFSMMIEGSNGTSREQGEVRRTRRDLPASEHPRSD